MAEQLTLIPQARDTERAAQADDLILVKQLPIIEEHLALARDKVLAETEAAKSLIATPDTLKSVKDARARIRKRFDALEQQRKAVKEAIMEPYTHFEAVYKDCVSGPYKDADADLKRKIDAVERDLDNAVLDKCYAYFREAAEAKRIGDWYDFDRLHLKVGAADRNAKTPKRLYDLISAETDRVSNDLDAIAGMDDAAEILAEYKITLDISSALSIVQTRHRRIETERQAAAQRAEEARAEAERQAAMAAAMAAATQPEEPAVLQAPVEVQVQPAKSPDDVLTITFKVTSTRAKLMALRNYLQREGIPYE